MKPKTDVVGDRIVVTIHREIQRAILPYETCVWERQDEKPVGDPLYLERHYNEKDACRQHDRIVNVLKNGGAL